MTSIMEVDRNGTVPAWHARFLHMMPAIRRHACALFRNLSRQERDEAIAEVTAVAMMDYLGGIRGVKGVEGVEGIEAEYADPATLATSAALRVSHSERACGRESSRDVLSPSAQRQLGFKVEHLKQSCETDRLRMRIDRRARRPVSDLNVEVVPCRE